MTPNENIFFKFVLTALTFIYVFFAPAFYWIGSVGFFISADLILRLLICKRNKVLIQSEKMWRTVYKFGFALIFILSALVFQNVFLTEIPIMKIIASYLILVELRSIDEKAQEVTGSSLFKIAIDKFSIKDKRPNKNKNG